MLMRNIDLCKRNQYYVGILAITIETRRDISLCLAHMQCFRNCEKQKTLFYNLSSSQSRLNPLTNPFFSFSAFGDGGEGKPTWCMTAPRKLLYKRHPPISESAKFQKSLSRLSISPTFCPIDHKEAASKFTVKFIGDKRGNVLPFEKSPALQLLLIHVGNACAPLRHVFMT